MPINSFNSDIDRRALQDFLDVKDIPTYSEESEIRSKMASYFDADRLVSNSNLDDQTKKELNNKIKDLKSRGRSEEDVSKLILENINTAKAAYENLELKNKSSTKEISKNKISATDNALNIYTTSYNDTDSKIFYDASKAQELLQNLQNNSRDFLVSENEENREVSLIKPDKKKICNLQLISVKDGTPHPTLSTYALILDSTNENIKARYAIKQTLDTDVIEFLGGDTLVWQYGGVTIADYYRDGKTGRLINMYDDLSNFSLRSVGRPYIDRIPYQMKLTYGNFVRIGFLLEINFSRNAIQDKLINVSFTMVIDKFYKVSSSETVGNL